MDRVAGRILKTGKPVIAEDAEHHPKVTGPFVYAENIKSSAGYLLRTSTDQKVGVLFVNYRDAQVFSQEERAFLEKATVRIADTVAGWLVETPDLRAELSALAGRPREEAALQEITDTAREVLGSEAVAIWMTGQQGDRLSVTAQSGLKEQSVRDASLGLTNSSSAVSRAFQTKEVVKGSVLESGTFSEEQARIMRLDTVWAFPILSQFRPLGVFSVYPVGYEDLAPDEKALINAFVNQTAATIESQRNILTLTKLHDIGRRLTFTLEDPQQLMQEIVISAARVTEADSVAIHQYDSSRREFYHFDESVTYGGEPYSPSDRPRPGGVSEYVVEHGLLSVADVGEVAPDLVRASNVLAAGVKAYLGIRLKAGESIVGVLFLNYNEKREFSPDDVTIATTFANYAATAIHNSRLYRESLQRARRLDLVRKVAKAVSSVFDLDEILQLVVDGLARVFEVKQSAIALLDESGEYLEGRAEYHETDSVSAIGRKIPVEDNPQVEEILETKRALIVEDVQHDPIMSKVRDIMAERKTLSMMIVPITIDGEVVGTIGIDAVEQKRRFTDEEAELAQAVADQAAIAIRNAQLFQQREALQEIAQDITSILDRDELLEKTLRRSLELLNCEFGSISVFDPKSQLLRFKYAVGKSSDRYVEMGEGLIGTAARSRTTIRVDDVSKDGRYVEHIGETRSELDVPMIVGKRLVGVLNAESKRLNAFSAEDQHLAEALAAQAAVAFHTAELYEDAQATLEERVESIKALQDVFEAVGREPLEKILELITKQAVNLTPAQYGNLWLLEHQHQQLRFGVEVNLLNSLPRLSDRIPIDDESINGWVAQTGQSYLCEDVADDQHYQEIISDVRSELAVPLKRGERTIGTLNVESTEVAAFQKDDQRLVEALAGQAAIAIDNARIYERLNTLSTLGRFTTQTLDLGEVLELIMQHSVETLAANRGTLRLLDSVTGELELRAYRGEIGKRAEEPIKSGAGVVGWVAEHGESQLVLDVKADERYVESLKGTRCELAVPIKTEDRTIGVLNIEHSQPNAFDEQDLDLLEAIAGQASAAIRNARLYESVQTVNEVGRTLTSGIRKKKDEILELIYEQAKKLTGAQDMYIALYDEETNLIRFGLATEHGERVEYKAREANMDKRGKTEEIILKQSPLLHKTLEESKAWYDEPGHTEFIGDVALSWLGVPLITGEQVLGMIALYDWDREHAYDEQDLQVFSSMASQAAIALDNATLYYDINQRLESTNERLESANQQLKRRVEALAALNEVGQTLTSGIRLREGQILELVYEQAKRLTGAQDMYIALYDEDTGLIRFGLATEHGKRVEYEAREANMDKRGKTEEVILERKPILHKTLEESKVWYDEPEHAEFIGDVSPSYLGVPMIAGEKPLGVIALWDWDREYAYDEQDLQVFSSMASQAAIALDNARLYYRLEETVQERTRELKRAYDELRQAREREVWAALGEVTAGFIHKMSNTIGHIPALTKRVENSVDPADENAMRKLRRIREGVADALVYTGSMGKMLELKGITKEKASIRVLLDDALRQAIEDPVERDISLEVHYASDLPNLYVNSPLVIEALRNIIRNSVEAMPSGGKLQIDLLEAENGVEVRIADTGHGISEQDQSNVFELGFSSKQAGKGIGLWFSKTVIDQHQGTISFESEEGRGTTFYITLPVGRPTSQPESTQLEVSSV
jgi:GAF domain-containing protein